jgi:hypothetical protein
MAGAVRELAATVAMFGVPAVCAYLSGRWSR